MKPAVSVSLLLLVVLGTWRGQFLAMDGFTLLLHADTLAAILLHRRPIRRAACQAHQIVCRKQRNLAGALVPTIIGLA